MVIGFTHFFTMLLTLTIYSSLVQLPPNLRRAAADLGAGPVATFRHVIWPMTLPGVATGAFLTFALCIGDYVTPQILGGGNDLALPQLVMLQIGRRGGPADGLGFVDRADGGGDGGLSSDRAVHEDGAMKRFAACAGYMLLIYGFIFLPVVVLVLFSFQDGRFPVPPL